MKLLWNPLLITLGILLPTSTVLAEPSNSSESTLLTVQTEELELVLADSKEAAPNSETARETISLGVNASTELMPGVASVAIAQKKQSTPKLKTIPEITSVVSAEETQSNLAPDTIVIPEITPVSPLSISPAEEILAKPSPEAIQDLENTRSTISAEVINREETTPEVVSEEVVETESTAAESETTTEVIPDKVVETKSTATESETTTEVIPEEVAETESTTAESETTTEVILDKVVETKSTATESETTTEVIPEEVVETESKTAESETTTGVSGKETEEREESLAESETTTDTETDSAAIDGGEKPELRPEEIARYQKLLEADQFYLSGDLVAAEKLYREVKEPFASEVESEVEEIPEPIYDPAELNPAGAVYWRLYQEGLEQPQLESKVLAPLQLLVEQHPQFIPGHLNYARVLEDNERDEEGLQVLQRAVTLYPNEPELLRAKIEEDKEDQRWLEASISARQFALFNQDHPQASEFTQLADENLKRYQDHLRSKLTWNAIGNVITGAAGYVLTGSLLGPLSALETTILLLQGESAVGDRFSNQLRGQLPMIEDEEVLEYVRSIGNKLASVAGRDEFEYEFYVVMDDQLNAFALPGGKIFVNAGAIAETNSEAELAGLLAHELAHAVLSHGFQLVTQGNLTANITQFIPYVGPTAGNLLVLNYSRDMERQADVFGTRILVAAGYAADGVRNLMAILNEQDNPSPPAWLSTHPDTKERVRYLENLILSNDFNRYAYEGVARHREIKERVAELLESQESRQSENE
ncbi:MAG: M48 family metalloprotease [Xenococcaceae cyanobacterium]